MKRFPIRNVSAISRKPCRREIEPYIQAGDLARISLAEARKPNSGGIGGNDRAAICQNEKLFLQRGDENRDSYGPRSHAAR
jgi:hypothetical protein